MVPVRARRGDRGDGASEGERIGKGGTRVGLVVTRVRGGSDWVVKGGGGKGYRAFNG
jgi:hypothetical protein